MPFDFPASPAIGDASNGYVFNGTGWAGGAQAGPVTEQFFDLSGVASFDITVPTWAKGCEFTANINNSTAGGGALLMRVSTDGTTFFAGASDYLAAGFIHYTGTSAFSNYAATLAAQFLLSGTHDSVITPIVVEGTFAVSRAVGTLFAGMVRSKAYNSGAAFAYMDGDLRLTFQATTNDLTIKKLRFIGGLSAVPFAAGTYLTVKWLGNSAEVPQSNAIPEAPQDGGEYVRVNGVWRLKHQSFVMDGTTAFDISVPSGARMMRALGSVQHVAGGGSLCARASWDGTNFPATASDYHQYVGWIQYSGGASPGMNSLVSAVGTQIFLTFNNDAATVTDMFDWRMNLIRPASGVAWSGLVNSMSYQTAAANLYNNTQHRVAVMNTNAGSVLDLKKFRFYNGNSAVFGVPSTLAVDWMY